MTSKAKGIRELPQSIIPLTSMNPDVPPVFTFIVTDHSQSGPALTHGSYKVRIISIVVDLACSKLNLQLMCMCILLSDLSGH